MQRSRAAQTCGALRLVGGCTWRYNNVGGVTAGQAPHNSMLGLSLQARWDTMLASTASTSPCVLKMVILLIMPMLVIMLILLK